MTEELIAELRRTFLFEPFSEEQVYWLVAHSTVVSLEPGEYALTETQQPDALWVLLSGEWRLSRTVSGRDVAVSTSSTPGVWAGWLPIFDERIALDVRARRASRLLRIPSVAVQHMLVSGYPIASHLISGIYDGVQTLMMQTRQQEKMIALGKLSAGLAHELNNPASAARRAAAELRRVLSDEQDAALLLATAGRSPSEAAALTNGLKDLGRELEERRATAERLDPLAYSDREDTLAAWLDDHGVSKSYDAAGTLVDAGVDVAWLEDVAQSVPPEALQAVLRSIIVTATAGALVDQVERSTMRVCDLVAAIKSYSYMDQASLQDVDVHEGLESTLTMLGHKLQPGITIVRDFDQSLPRIRASGSDLNQVWTNLIDNAIDAMDGTGELHLVTRREADDVVVEIGDDGHGIPPDVQARIFEPFFTTKDVGQGSGLGLDITYRIVVTQHHGDITARSTPGDTVFSVRLPITDVDDTTRDATVGANGAGEENEGRIDDD
ncbi:MAG TPA: ATP-binding protein [Chloroflexota bacterium]